MPIKIDRDLLRRSLREEDIEVLDRVQANVDAAVQKVLAEFKTEVEKKLQELVETDRTSSVSKELEKLAGDFQSGVESARTQIGVLDEKLASLGGDNELTAAMKKSLDEAKAATKKLGESVQALEDKAKSLGKVTGGAAAAAIRTVLV